MTVKGGTSPACAACKYQRRKCAADCVLAPYFPASQPKMFQNAHRLFGISNITKILKQLTDDDQKADAMKSIIFEADMRERFPVYGCVEYIYYLNQQLKEATDELRCVYAQLAVYREQHLLGSATTSYNNNHQHQPPNLLQNYGINSLAEMCYPMNANLFGSTEEDQSSESVGKPNLFSVEEPFYNTVSISPFPQEHGLANGHFSNTIIDDSQSYIETKETCGESSSESSLFKDNEELCKSELRNAASYFSLTS